MKFTAGETVTITLAGNVLRIKVEDASKGESICTRVEEVLSGGDAYKTGQVYEFNRTDIAT